MNYRGRIVGAVILIALARLAHAETESKTQAVIRGTGKDVTIVYRSSPRAAREARSVAPAEENSLTEAAQMKRLGATDESVISHLRLHQADLPAVVSLETVDQLRQSGVGRPVIAYLSTLTAVEVGETGEGSEVIVASAPAYGPGDMGWLGAGYLGEGYSGSGGYFGWGGSLGFGRHAVQHGQRFLFRGAKPFGHIFPRMPAHHGHMGMSPAPPMHAAQGHGRMR